MKTAVLNLANDKLAFTLFSDASAQIEDRQHNKTWTMGPVALQERGHADEGYCWSRFERYHNEAYAGRFKAEVNDGIARISLHEEYVGRRGTFEAAFALDDAFLVIDIRNIGSGIPCLTYPTPLSCDQLVLPKAQGMIVDHNLKGNPFGHNMIGFYGGLNMRWFGGLQGKHGWIAIMEQGAEFAHLLFKGTVAAPLWIKSLGQWDYQPKVRIGFVDNGYVGLAKAFQNYLRTRGEFTSLTEKMEANPNLKRLVGGRGVGFMMAKPYHPESYEDFWLEPPEGYDTRFDINFTFKRCAEIVADCKRLGMTNGFFKLDGWYRGGYDALHPDIWPPAPELGSLDEFQAITRQPEPYACLLHDNYNDTYMAAPSFPKGVCIDRHGHPLPGGRWAGGLAYMMNTRDSLEYARRNAAHYAELGNAGIYCDTLPGRPLESFEQGNTLTRTQDKTYRCKIVDLFKEKDMFVGGEDGSDYVMQNLDCIPLGKHSRQGNLAVPLLALIYHDSVIGFRNIGMAAPDGSMSACMRERCLDNVLWGWVNVLRGFTSETWDVWQTCFTESMFVDRWHTKIATDEMVDHHFLSEDLQVERTEWSSGRAITVNYADEPRSVDGNTLAPRSIMPTNRAA